ncbi:hypothetical protein Tco_0972466 [Tanacetum coccineum]
MAPKRRTTRLNPSATPTPVTDTHTTTSVTKTMLLGDGPCHSEEEPSFFFRYKGKNKLKGGPLWICRWGRCTLRSPMSWELDMALQYMRIPYVGSRWGSSDDDPYLEHVSQQLLSRDYAVHCQLQSADHRRQGVIKELLAADHQRQVQLTKALQMLKGLHIRYIPKSDPERDPEEDDEEDLRRTLRTIADR